jgi:alkanesulfonate monooxygenase SsuD/methylene tetrahydromethanopterin reductase-like flavin-dependent oxidoreductase (luciferase family)
VKFGFVIPYGDARTVADLAHEAEAVGWDAIFVWEPVWGIDAWICLTAAAMRTERIRLGTMLTPLSRMRPWKLASETATLDNLSNGRVIVAVGLGAVDTGFANFGEETERKILAELLDEGLEILTGLWRGQPFEFHGKHYNVTPFDRIVAQPLVQQPRIPIWVVGAHGRRKSLARVARYDGLLPNVVDPNGPTRAATPAELAEMVADIRRLRTYPAPFDVIVEGETPGDDPVKATEILRPWLEAGTTWWLEAMWSAEGPQGLDRVTARLRQGPPRAV